RFCIVILMGLSLGLISCQPAPQAFDIDHESFHQNRFASAHKAQTPHSAETTTDSLFSNSLEELQERAFRALDRADQVTRRRIHFRFLAAAAEALVTVYPDWLHSYGKEVLFWKDGSAMQFSLNISTRHFHTLMKDGRLRMRSFFEKMYGDSKADVRSKLTRVRWLPKSKNLGVMFTSENGAAEALKRVSKRLDSLPHLHKYLAPTGGSFNWRKIAGSELRSAHSYGIAMDINTKYGDYWRWAPEFKKGEPLKYRNRVPMEIVEIFEAEGFVWGGRWPHYDTMHFEYRPEVKLYNEWFQESIFALRN
ncbi:MAG: M15 family metallopeptidase, partial [Bacteroidota bacterium]